MKRFAAFFPAFLAVLIGAWITLWPAVAWADIERFAVIVGDNKGDTGDVELHYAESDATKISNVLRDLGGFEPANTVLLRGEDAGTVTRTLIAINDRIRAAVARPDTQVVLFVYYSGHADATALHLSGSRLDLTQVEQLVRGSAATIRVLMLDACRSGALTRIKGGANAAPFAIDVGEHLSDEGLAYLTSSSGNEDAQESDELRGSFFTHHFASALVGAGDTDSDGRVTLEEAYRYAFDATLRSTSRTFAGLQHPAFRYDLRGKGKFVLTTLRGENAQRAMLSFPANRTYLVMEGNAAGAVVAEIDAVDRARRISVRAGHYFVRGRLTDAMLEGDVAALAGYDTTVGDEGMHRTEYARLVRKGGSDVTVSHGVEAGYELRTPMKNASTLCQGAFAGYAQHRLSLDLSLRLDACHASTTTNALRSDDNELGGEVRAARAWDLPIVTVSVGLVAGGSWLHQSFSTSGIAPIRDSAAGRFGASLNLGVPVRRGFSINAESAGFAYVFEQDTTGGGTSLGPWFTFRQSLAIEKEW